MVTVPGSGQPSQAGLWSTYISETDIDISKLPLANTVVPPVVGPSSTSSGTGLMWLVYVGLPVVAVLIGVIVFFWYKRRGRPSASYAAYLDEVNEMSHRRSHQLSTDTAQSYLGMDSGRANSLLNSEYVQPHLSAATSERRGSHPHGDGVETGEVYHSHQSTAANNFYTQPTATNNFYTQ